jgi:hypothetical protein
MANANKKLKDCIGFVNKARFRLLAASRKVVRLREGLV